MVSLINFMDGSGGSIKVFWAINSFNMSFCIVPPILFKGTPCFLAQAIYMDHITVAGGFMVMEVVTSPRGIPSTRTRKSSNVSIATPHFPTSPADLGLSESYPMRVGKSKAVLRPVCPSFKSKCHLSLVSLAVPRPENILYVQILPLYPVW